MQTPLVPYLTDVPLKWSVAWRIAGHGLMLRLGAIVPLSSAGQAGATPIL